MLAHSAALRSVLLSAGGACFGDGYNKWTYMSKCKALLGLPIWWQIEAVKQMKTRTYKKGSKILSSGSSTEFVFFIKKGEVVFDIDDKEDPELKVTICTLKEYDVIGQLAFFSGCASGYTARATSDTQVFAWHA